MLRELARQAQRRVEEDEWLLLDAASARLFRPGDVVERDQELGRSPGSGVVRAICRSEVVRVEYDCERDLLILAISTARDGQAGDCAWGFGLSA
jgi:hypothetical protein